MFNIRISHAKINIALAAACALFVNSSVSAELLQIQAPAATAATVATTDVPARLTLPISASTPFSIPSPIPQSALTMVPLTGIQGVVPTEVLPTNAPPFPTPALPSIFTPAPSTVVPSVQLPLKGKTIVVNAGHGGKDTGAIYGGIYEKNVNLAIALKVRNLLSSFGATVIMTRTDDRFMSLPAIDEVTSSVKPDAFLAIHCNAGRKKMHGIESFYFYPEGKNYAALLLKFVSEKMGRPANFAHYNNFYVIDHTRVPAALVEVGYLSNQQDRAYLTRSSDQDTIAIALAEGIVQFLAGAQS